MSVATVAVADVLEAASSFDLPGPPLAAPQTGGVPEVSFSQPAIPAPLICDAASGGARPARGGLPIPASPARPASPTPPLPRLPERSALPGPACRAEAVVPDLSPVSDVLGQLDAVQAEFDGLRSELNLLRRRDETLNFYLHRLDEELRLAARLQQDFLPRSLPEVGPIRFHTLFRPAGYVSGDLYDVARLDERRVGFYVADAVGHGMPAALLTMFIKQALVTKEILRPGEAGGAAGAGEKSGSPDGAPTYRLLDPGESLARLNATLVEQDLSQATFATALYGVIDTATLEMRFAKAGHPSPLLLRADGGHEWLDADGPLLGIFAGESFPARTLQLRPGDRVILYTDGIEMAFGDPQEPRWQEELLRRRHLSSEQLLHEFSDQIDRESGSLDPRDDLTMMVMEVEG